MIIPEAISILKIHQQWRLGADIVMIEPKELTKAIDVLINYHTDIMNETLSSQTEISNEEIEKGAKEWYEKEGPYKPSAIALKTWVYAIKWYREQIKQL